jgi:hypothetical protein
MLPAHSTAFWRSRGNLVAVLLTGVLLFTCSEPGSRATSGSHRSAVTAKRRAFLPDEKEKQAKAREQSQNNLKNLGIALWGYNEVFNHLPAPAILSKKDRTPLLSWRVAILPYLGQKNAYNKFRLDEPWDSPNNRKLLKEMPKVFEAPGVKTTTPHVTFYQAVVGKNAAWRTDKILRIQGADFPNGTALTILLVEGSEPVPWTKPADIAYDAEKALPKFGWLKEGFNVLLADGDTRFINRKVVSEKTLRSVVAPIPNKGPGLDWNDPKGFEP